METKDFELLFIFYKEGLLDDSKYERNYKHDYGDAFIKLRSRDLIVSTKVGKHSYKYDITNSGLEVLKRWDGFKSPKSETQLASEVIQA